MKTDNLKDLLTYINKAFEHKIEEECNMSKIFFDFQEKKEKKLAEDKKK